MSTHTLPRRTVLQRLAWAAAAALSPGLALASAPPLMRPAPYRPGMPLDGYWVSEKYDGVRGYWDGKQLWTRGGQPIHPPAWFSAGWPATPMDGELWAGRGAFASAVSTVRQQVATDAAWRQMRYMVFDLPAHPGVFDARIPALQDAVAAVGTEWAQAVPQSRASSTKALQSQLHSTVQSGGEGLVLHLGSSRYHTERNDDLLKFKPFDDAEAQVIAHLPGQGKYAGMLGALLVQTPEGQRFKLGTGFSDAERRDPPALGSWVSYRFRDHTPSGLPRFASYLRPRDDMAL